MREIETRLREWLASEEAFVDRLISKLPPPPPNFTRIVELDDVRVPWPWTRRVPT